MSEPQTQHALINRLANELAPVRRLRPPWQRAGLWVLLTVVAGLVLIMHFGARAMVQRWVAAPVLVGASVGAVLTAITAGWAAFALSVPGYSRRWVWLPLAPALLWIVSSGVGCLGPWVGSPTLPDQGYDCLVTIISFSIPLSVLMIVLLRRACPLYPLLTASLAGLASAAASAALLEIFHASQITAADLLTHAVAVAVVVVLNLAMGGRLLSKV